MSKVILVIEDNNDNMLLMNDLLEAHDYSVLQAVDGASGIEMARTQQPDAIFLDIQLPDIHGLDVLAHLRDLNLNPSPLIIVVTSHALAGDKHHYLASGCDAYMAKPIDPQETISTLEGLFGEPA